MIIDQEHFLKCRNELLQSLKINDIPSDDALLLCASVLNEYLVGKKYSVSIILVPVVFKSSYPQTEEGKPQLFAGCYTRIESSLEGDFLHEIHQIASDFSPNEREAILNRC